MPQSENERESEQAAETLHGDQPVVLLVEHASSDLPAGWDWPEADKWLLGTHWVVDIGAGEFCRALHQRVGSTVVLARFSRLLVDANREIQSPSLFLTHAEGRPIVLNQGLSASERQLRIERCWEPYHKMASQAVRSVPAGLVVGMHSFTPSFEGRTREMEVGVLFDEDASFGQWAAEWLAQAGLKVAINEPYSGRNGLMYSPQRHATAHGRPAIELELRQDLVGDPVWRDRWVPVFGAFLEAAIVWGRSLPANR